MTIPSGNDEEDDVDESTTRFFETFDDDDGQEKIAGAAKMDDSEVVKVSRRKASAMTHKLGESGSIPLEVNGASKFDL